MNKQQAENLIDKIIKDHFNDELPVFELEREKLFENAWNENYEVQEISDFEGINKAAYPLEMVLGCISTLIATVKTIIDISKSVKSRAEKSGNQSVQIEFVTEKWLAQLQLAGLNQDKARLIANSFSTDLEKIICNDK